jgi:hypothetical protein
LCVWMAAVVIDNAEGFQGAAIYCKFADVVQACASSFWSHAASRARTCARRSPVSHDHLLATRKHTLRAHRRTQKRRGTYAGVGEIGPLSDLEDVEEAHDAQDAGAATGDVSIRSPSVVPSLVVCP